MSVLEPGDRLVVSELSRLGRSLGQIVAMLDVLAKEGIAIVAIKEQIRIEDKQDIQTKVMTTLFALFAEVERDLISERTREGLARARSSGKKLGRPKGSLGVSRLDGKEDEIRHFLRLGVSKSAIAKITGVSSPTLSVHFYTNLASTLESTTVSAWSDRMSLVALPGSVQVLVEGVEDGLEYRHPLFEVAEGHGVGCAVRFWNVDFGFNVGGAVVFTDGFELVDGLT